MSDRQRLINKYISDLPTHIKTLYRLHFLRFETEPNALHMIESGLADTNSQCPVAGIKDAIDEIIKDRKKKVKIGGYIHLNKKEQNKESSIYFGSSDLYQHKAVSFMRQMLYENALEEFSKCAEKNPSTPFYKERCECYFVLGQNPLAYDMAIKSNDPEKVFLMSVLVGDLERANQLIPVIRSHVKNGSHYLATLFELSHILIYISLAFHPIEDTISLYESLTQFQNHQDFPVFIELFDAMSNRVYSRAISLLPTIYQMLNESIYTSPNADLICQAINDNIVAIAIKPYARVRLDFLISSTGLSKDELVQSIRRSIRNGKIDGRLNLIDGLFDQKDITEHKQQREITDKMQIIMEKFELAMWQKNQPILTNQYESSKIKNKANK